MKQFQVPQFITVEDKVIGPLTIKQAVFVLGGVIVIAVVRMALVPFLFYPIALIIAAIAAALAFLKIGDIPFPTIVKNGFWYAMRPHVYIWKKEKAKKSVPAQAKDDHHVTVNATPKLSESKLSDLAWSLNIKEKFRESEDKEASQ
ncbi:MAG: PrgI family protein [Patescibacteria group bacterium]